MRPIKILHVVPTYLPATRYGGPIHSVHGLCKSLAARGEEVHVYTTNVDGPTESPVPLGETVRVDGVDVTYFQTGWLRRIYRAPAMAQRLGQTVGEFDLVHIHAIFHWPGLAASRAARRSGVPYIVSPRGMLVPSLVASKSRLVKKVWLSLFDHAMLEKAAAVHVTTTVEKSEMRSLGVMAGRVLIVPNGIDMPEVQSGSSERGPHVLYLGRLDRKKSIEILLKAIARVPGVPLVVAGDGDKAYVKSLKQLSTKLGLDDRVSFIGHLDDAGKWKEYRRASLFVLPSVSENFANVVLEAMAAGCPVVVSPGVGLAETVARYDCGRVVPRDPEEIASAVRELLDQAELRERMSENGMTAARNFSWERIAADMSEVYRELTAVSATARGEARGPHG